MRAEYRARVPAARQHLRTVQCETDTGSHFIAAHRGKQESFTADLPEQACAGKERRQHNRCRVQRCERMKVVEFEALDEGAVEQRCRGCADRLAPADQTRVPTAFKRADEFHCLSRPGQLRADERATQPVERQVFATFERLFGDVVELHGSEPCCQFPCRTVRVRGG
jgi:hypothetical protein